jgi:hypothetical protein
MALQPIRIYFSVNIMKISKPTTGLYRLDGHMEYLVHQPLDNLWWKKWHWSRFSQSTSVSLATHSTNCSTLSSSSSSSSSSRSGTRGQIADVPNGLPLSTPPKKVL